MIYVDGLVLNRKVTAHSTTDSSMLALTTSLLCATRLADCRLSPSLISLVSVISFCAATFHSNSSYS